MRFGLCKNLFFCNHERSDINLTVHKAVIKIVAGQDYGTKNILVKGVWVQMPHTRSAATGHCNAESWSFPWFLLAVVTGDLMTPWRVLYSPGHCLVKDFCSPCRLVTSDSYSPPKERYWYIINKKCLLCLISAGSHETQTAGSYALSLPPLFFLTVIKNLSGRQI